MTATAVWRRRGHVLLLVALLFAASAAYVLQAHPHFASRLFKAVSSGVGSGPAAYSYARTVDVKVDVANPGKPISPYIYGIAAAGGRTVKDLGATVNRWGGNPSSSYNWVDGNAWNAGRDWGFRNVNYGDPTGGSNADAFVASTLAAGAVPLMTVPTMGWVAKDSNNAHLSRSVPGQGGAPLNGTAGAISGYDPATNRAATSVPSLPSRAVAPAGQAANTVYQDDWIHHLARGFGPAAIPFLAMDNEPDLWSYTHTDVHPARMGYDTMVRNFLDYATVTKAADPAAQVLGPDLSGWTAYNYSELDRGNDGFKTHADRAAHGDQPFLPWWLDQVRAHDKKTGQRLLDVLDVHYYPQADGVYDGKVDPASQALRIRSTRSLFDPTYKDESWIDEPVSLIPRLKGWIAGHYPGTKLAITEYNWGAENDASGGVALAEALGIFGREGVDIATYWKYPKPGTPAGAAFRLYRNYDGHGATFGDSALPVDVSNPGISAFAARHSDTQTVDVVLINQSVSEQATVRVGTGAPVPATAYVVNGGSSSIDPVALDPAAPTVSLPPMSMALVHLGAHG